MFGGRRVRSLAGMTTTKSTRSDTRRHPLLGLPFTVIVGLALLAAPRAVLHDLGITHGGSALNQLLAVVPLLVWVAAVAWARVPNPFLTVVIIGACYGVLLAAIHQLLWQHAFAGAPPALGGNFSQLDIGIRQLVVRIAAVFSSLFTGVAVGAIVGLLTWAVSKVVQQAGMRS
jgi:hypothetical protein